MSLDSAVYTREAWPRLGRPVRNGIFGLSTVHEVSTDVVVIGSGAGGSVVAAELAEAGFDVLVIEEGGYHKTESFTTAGADMARMLYRDGGVQVAIGRPPVMVSEGCCVGGTTVVNGGMTFRTPQRILRSWRDEHGLGELSASRTEQLFARVERRVSAAPQTPDTRSEDNERFKNGAERLGYRVVDNVRNQLHCAGSNNCVFGCPTGAKRSTLVSYLPRAAHFGARLLSDCRVDKITTHGNRATGVLGTVLGAAGKPVCRFVVRAREVVVACGAVQTPALLLRSGIRSDSKRVGENFALHPNVKLVARFEHALEGWKGAHQLYQVREFEAEGFVMAAVNLPPSILAMTLPAHGARLGEIMSHYSNILSAGVLVEDTTSGRVRLGPLGRPLCVYRLGDRDLRHLMRGAALLADVLFAAGAIEVFPPFHGDALTSSKPLHQIAAQGLSSTQRATFELASVHVMGTCAMGADIKRHVCDGVGRVYGMRNLRVADASLFPSPVGVNPMETVMMLATHVAADMIS